MENISGTYDTKYSKFHIRQQGTALVGRLQTRGFGSAKPVADNASEMGRAQNRRVELVRQ